MAGSEIKSTIFVSRQPAMQNIYLTTYKTKTKYSQKKIAHFAHKVSDYLRRFKII